MQAHAAPPVDQLSLGAIGALAAVSMAVLPGPLTTLLMLSACAAALALTATGTSPLSRTLHAFFPYGLVVALFMLLGPVIDAATPKRWDHALASIDALLFRTLGDTWRAALGRPSWLTDLASLGYASYYFLPLAIAVALWRRGDVELLQRFAFTSVAGFLVTYVCYFAFPAEGPRLSPGAHRALVGGGQISELVRSFVEVAERTRADAFPSGHAAIGVLEAWLAWRLVPKMRAAAVVSTALSIFATVYLHYHYVVDVVAGLALGALLPALWGLHPEREDAAGLAHS